MTDAEIRLQLLLSTQRALLAAVPASLRSVTCGWEGTEIELQFLFDGDISEDDEESAKMAGTEVIANFPAPWTMTETIDRFDYPADLRSRALPLWAYARKEKPSEGPMRRRVSDLPMN